MKGVTDRLNSLKASMPRTGDSPELTASAAELRSLIYGHNYDVGECVACYRPR